MYVFHWSYMDLQELPDRLYNAAVALVTDELTPHAPTPAPGGTADFEAALDASLETVRR